MRFVLFFLIFIAFFSCSKDGIPTIPNRIVCKIDGERYDAPAAGTIVSGVTSFSGNSNNKVLNISLEATNFSPPDTFKIYGGSTTTCASYTLDITNTTNPIVYHTQNMTGEVGKVIVTEYTNNFLKGTFEFKAIKLNDPSDTINVTDGGFNVMIVK